MSSDDGEARALERGARALGVQLDPGRAAQLIRYLDELYFWNATAGLTTIGRDAALRLHLLDSLSVVPSVAESGTIVDLGSGGGLPGIPIAIALPSARVTLIESRRRKCTFLTHVVRALRLRNCLVLQRDARKPGECTAAFGAVMARAFLPATDLLAIGKTFARPSGRIVIMGARREHELDNLGYADPVLVRVEDRSFELPGGDERRRVVVFETTVEH